MDPWGFLNLLAYWFLIPQDDSRESTQGSPIKDEGAAYISMSVSDLEGETK